MTPARMTLALLCCALGACTTPAGSPTLANTAWRFASIDGSAPVSSATSLEFGERLNANVGCNGMSGPWRVEANRLIAGPLVATRMYCEGIMEQEAAVSELLSERPALIPEGDELTITSSGHSAVLTRARTD